MRGLGNAKVEQHILFRNLGIREIFLHFHNSLLKGINIGGSGSDGSQSGTLTFNDFAEFKYTHGVYILNVEKGVRAAWSAYKGTPTLLALHQAQGSELAERTSDRDPAGTQPGAQLGLGGELIPTAPMARVDLLTEIVKYRVCDIAGFLPGHGHSSPFKIAG